MQPSPDPECASYRPLLAAYLGQGLSSGEIAQLETHLAACAECRARLAQLQNAAALSCQELVELVTEYLEGALPPPERERFEAHLSLCEGCHTYVEQIRQTMLLTRRLTEEDIPSPARDALLAAFRQWKHA